MCIVIDTNTLSKVFKCDNKEHLKFKPVLDWIINGNGRIIVGGSTFDREIFEKIGWFRNLFIQLKKVNKVVIIDNAKVDALQIIIQDMKKHKDFDDPHIVALLGASKCRVLCTGDLRSLPFIRDKTLYPKKVFPPMIYTDQNNAAQLCDKNVADCCLPKVKLRKRELRVI